MVRSGTGAYTKYQTDRFSGVVDNTYVEYNKLNSLQLPFQLKKTMFQFFSFHFRINYFLLLRVHVFRPKVTDFQPCYHRGLNVQNICYDGTIKNV